MFVSCCSLVELLGFYIICPAIRSSCHGEVYLYKIFSWPRDSKHVGICFIIHGIFNFVMNSFGVEIKFLWKSCPLVQLLLWQHPYCLFSPRFCSVCESFEGRVQTGALIYQLTESHFQAFLFDHTQHLSISVINQLLLTRF